MNLSDKELLTRLGAGESIDTLCNEAGVTRTEFADWWRRQIEARCPSEDGEARATLAADLTIERDQWGIPHIFAESDADLFFGFGYAMAADRLFQLDYLRRKGLGRLAEILGPDGIPFDTVARTVGLHRIAAAELGRLDRGVRDLLDAFSAGVNALIADSGDNLPIEFALLDYRPEPWSAVDCLAIEIEFRWYLTGRLPVIAMPELAKRALGEGALYDEYLLAEADDASILHPGEYEPAAAQDALEPIGHVMADPDDAVGSNNWVIAGRRTTTGRPLLASDPHIAFEAVSCWYPVHLCGGSFNVAGTAYAGIPALMIGRNERVAWGITNNICMQRDLYQERTSDEKPGCFLFNGEWEPLRQRHESITVKGAGPVELTVRSSRNGPIVDELLPVEARSTGPVSLRWLGMYEGGWLTALLGMNRAADCDSFRESLRPWHVPTFSLVFADVDGQIGYQSTGRIPVRAELQRGYRPGWDSAHQWRGLIPFAEMPQLADPERGWIATANNRVAPDDFPHKLFGCWVSGCRAQRIQDMIESAPQLSTDDMRRMQTDVTSLRARQLVPTLLEQLGEPAEPQLRAAIDALRAWDCCSTADSVGAAVFNLFFTAWCRRVAAARFPAEQVELMAKGVEWCAGRLLMGDTVGWLGDANRQQLIHDALAEAVALLTDRCGPDASAWTWGEIHRMPRPHVLSTRGDLGQLLDRGNEPVDGDVVSVGNTGNGPNWTATTGGGYRMVCDLSSQPPSLQLVDTQGQSGHPGSPHYDDQFAIWRAGELHEVALDPEAVKQTIVSRFTISQTT